MISTYHSVSVLLPGKSCQIPLAQTQNPLRGLLNDCPFHQRFCAGKL